MTCRGATCGTINITEPKSWITGNAMVITPLNQNVDKLYLKYILPFANLKSVITGSAQPQITRTNLEILKIPLPPLEIQRQIIAECEQVESQSQHIKDLIALYRDLISAILNKCGISDTHPLTPSAREGEIRGESSAIKGESMPSLRESRSDSWQSTNTDLLIESLLSQITTLQSNLDFKILPTPKSSPQGRGLDLSLARGKSTDSPSLAEGVRGWVESLTDLLKSLPTPPKQGWDKVAISQIAQKLLAGGDKPKAFSETKTQECPIPIYANATEKQGLYGYTNKPTITQNAVTISARGTIGYAVARFEPFYPIVRLIVLIPNKNANLKFLELVINNNKVERSGVNIPQLTLPQFSSFKIPLPPLREQEKIIACIESIESKISALDSTLPALERTKSQILQKYL